MIDGSLIPDTKGGRSMIDGALILDAKRGRSMQSNFKMGDIEGNFKMQVENLQQGPRGTLLSSVQDSL